MQQNVFDRLTENIALSPRDVREHRTVNVNRRDARRKKNERTSAEKVSDFQPEKVYRGASEVMKKKKHNFSWFNQTGGVIKYSPLKLGLIALCFPLQVVSVGLFLLGNRSNSRRRILCNQHAAD